MGASTLPKEVSVVNSLLSKNGLVQLEQAVYTSGRSYKAKFKCHCGKVFTTSIYDVRSGKSKSCGCLRYASKPTQHMESRHPLYGTWLAMVARCTDEENKRWGRYGGRGIAVCPEWAISFAAFAKYVCETIGDRPARHTIDRIDNDKNYEPGNIRWATYRQQRINQSRVNRIDGVPIPDMFPKDVARRIYRRVWSGMSLKEAIAKPRRVVGKAKTP